MRNPFTVKYFNELRAKNEPNIVGYIIYRAHLLLDLNAKDVELDLIFNDK